MKNLVDAQLPNIYLKPGEIHVSRTPALVSTVLGSCVSITLYSPEARAGAMCHALLPSGSCDDGFRYVESAVRHMFDRLGSICGQQGGFEAKLFGGADVLSRGERPDSALSIGRQNVEAALRIIEKLGLVLTASDTNGDHGRKIFFYTGSGEVFMRKVKKTARQAQKALNNGSKG